MTLRVGQRVRSIQKITGVSLATCPIGTAGTVSALEANGLFVVRFDNGQRWYCYPDELRYYDSLFSRPINSELIRRP